MPATTPDFRRVIYEDLACLWCDVRTEIEILKVKFDVLLRADNHRPLRVASNLDRGAGDSINCLCLGNHLPIL